MEIEKRKTKYRILQNELIKGFRISGFTVIGILMLFESCSPYNSKKQPQWKHFYIDEQLPGSEWGTGGIGLADFNEDGNIDVAVYRRQTKTAYWYEQKNDSIWIQHIIDVLPELKSALGGVAIDMNQDGWMDMAFENAWFENPKKLDKSPDLVWESHSIENGHDMIAADVNSDGYDDLIIYNGKDLFWYNTSENLLKIVVDSLNDDHGGVSPHGFGDIDNDGDIDLIIPGYWFQNKGNGKEWKKNEWPYTPIQNASYGRSIRAWIADVNGDGKNDIVYSDCDTGGAHVYWVENLDKGTNWVVHKLPDPPTNKGDVQGTGSFHSLGVADFNQDGRLDIFAGEQEDPDQMYGDRIPMKPKGLKERGVIWYNTGGKSPEFSIFLLNVDNPGWHDAQLLDVDKDGDVDIVSKVWNKDGVSYHADYWRNELIHN